MKRVFASLVEFLRGSKKTVLLVVGVSLITLLVSTFVAIFLERSENLRIPSIGTIHTLNVEAYRGDIMYENGDSYVDWGTMFPGGSMNRSFYLRSISNVDGMLHLNTTNWNPPGISQYLNLSWNREGVLLHPREETNVTLTLTISSSQLFVDYVLANNVTEFSLDIHIKIV